MGPTFDNLIIRKKPVINSRSRVKARENTWKQSHYIEVARVVSHFYETGLAIWAGFGLVGSFFYVFTGNFFFNFFKNIVTSALKSCIK